MGLCFSYPKKRRKEKNACLEMRWSMLRYDSRTFTAQQAKMLKGDVTRKEIPEKYIYIDDGCFRADGRMREVILPPNCKIIGREAFFQCQITSFFSESAS